jgi:predicted NBD/HSP70 family sugar kinase
MKILAVDVGGSHVKALATGQSVPRRMVSGPTMDAATMVRGVKDMTADWEYDVVSLGYPGQVVHNLPAHDPANLGHGWIGFDYAAAFGRPTRIINDAAMQALGSYQGGRMLFIGVGTGLGSAMIVDGQLEPMELGHLVYKNKKTYEDYIGERGLVRLGKKAWRREVYAVIDAFRKALQPDYIILGGGNARLIKKLPEDVRRGSNANAFVGGFRLWGDTKTAPSGISGETPSPFGERMEMVSPVPPEATAYDEA